MEILIAGYWLRCAIASQIDRTSEHAFVGVASVNIRTVGWERCKAMEQMVCGAILKPIQGNMASNNWNSIQMLPV